MKMFVTKLKEKVKEILEDDGGLWFDSIQLQFSPKGASSDQYLGTSGINTDCLMEVLDLPVTDAYSAFDV